MAGFVREEEVVASPDLGPLVHTVYYVRATCHFQKNETGACCLSCISYFLSFSVGVGVGCGL